jgi:hypothetical protein
MADTGELAEDLGVALVANRGVARSAEPKRGGRRPTLLFGVRCTVEEFAFHDRRRSTGLDPFDDRTRDIGRRVARLVEPYETDRPPCEGDGRFELHAFSTGRHEPGGPNLPEHRLDRASTRQRPDPERLISFRPQDEDGLDVARRCVVTGDGNDRLPIVDGEWGIGLAELLDREQRWTRPELPTFVDRAGVVSKEAQSELPERSRSCRLPGLGMTEDECRRSLGCLECGPVEWLQVEQRQGKRYDREEECESRLDFGRGAQCYEDFGPLSHAKTVFPLVFEVNDEPVGGLSDPPARTGNERSSVEPPPDRAPSGTRGRGPGAG